MQREAGSSFNKINDIYSTNITDKNELFTFMDTLVVLEYASYYYYAKRDDIKDYDEDMTLTDRICEAFWAGSCSQRCQDYTHIPRHILFGCLRKPTAAFTAVRTREDTSSLLLWSSLVGPVRSPLICRGTDGQAETVSAAQVNEYLYYSKALQNQRLEEVMVCEEFLRGTCCRDIHCEKLHLLREAFDEQSISEAGTTSPMPSFRRGGEIQTRVGVYHSLRRCASREFSVGYVVDLRTNAAYRVDTREVDGVSNLCLVKFIVDPDLTRGLNPQHPGDDSRPFDDSEMTPEEFNALPVARIVLIVEQGREMRKMRPSRDNRADGRTGLYVKMQGGDIDTVVVMRSARPCEAEKEVNAVLEDTTGERHRFNDGATFVSLLPQKKQATRAPSGAGNFTQGQFEGLMPTGASCDEFLDNQASFLASKFEPYPLTPASKSCFEIHHEPLVLFAFDTNTKAGTEDAFGFLQDTLILGSALTPSRLPETGFDAVGRFLKRLRQCPSSVYLTTKSKKHMLSQGYDNCTLPRGEPGHRSMGVEQLLLVLTATPTGGVEKAVRCARVTIEHHSFAEFNEALKDFRHPLHHVAARLKSDAGKFHNLYLRKRQFSVRFCPGLPAEDVQLTDAGERRVESTEVSLPAVETLATFRSLAEAVSFDLLREMGRPFFVQRVDPPAHTGFFVKRKETIFKLFPEFAKKWDRLTFEERFVELKQVIEKELKSKRCRAAVYSFWVVYFSQLRFERSFELYRGTGEVRDWCSGLNNVAPIQSSNRCFFAFMNKLLLCAHYLPQVPNSPLDPYVEEARSFLRRAAEDPVEMFLLHSYRRKGKHLQSIAHSSEISVATLECPRVEEMVVAGISEDGVYLKSVIRTVNLPNGTIAFHASNRIGWETNLEEQSATACFRTSGRDGRFTIRQHDRVYVLLEGLPHMGELVVRVVALMTCGNQTHQHMQTCWTHLNNRETAGAWYHHLLFSREFPQCTSLRDFYDVNLPAWKCFCISSALHGNMPDENLQPMFVGRLELTRNDRAEFFCGVSDGQPPKACLCAMLWYKDGVPCIWRYLLEKARKDRDGMPTLYNVHELQGFPRGRRGPEVGIQCEAALYPLNDADIATWKFHSKLQPGGSASQAVQQLWRAVIDPPRRSSGAPEEALEEEEKLAILARLSPYASGDSLRTRDVDQLRVIDLVANNPEARVNFLVGPPGAGKSDTAAALIALLSRKEGISVTRNKVVLVLAECNLLLDKLAHKLGAQALRPISLSHKDKLEDEARQEGKERALEDNMMTHEEWLPATQAPESREVTTIVMTVRTFLQYPWKEELPRVAKLIVDEAQNIPDIRKMEILERAYLASAELCDRAGGHKRPETRFKALFCGDPTQSPPMIYRAEERALRRDVFARVLTLPPGHFAHVVVLNTQYRLATIVLLRISQEMEYMLRSIRFRPRREVGGRPPFPPVSVYSHFPEVKDASRGTSRYSDSQCRFALQLLLKAPLTGRKRTVLVLTAYTFEVTYFKQLRLPYSQELDAKYERIQETTLRSQGSLEADVVILLTTRTECTPSGRPRPVEMFVFPEDLKGAFTRASESFILLGNHRWMSKSHDNHLDRLYDCISEEQKQYKQ